MERLSVLYASALFDLALERGAVDEYREQALLLQSGLQDADVATVFLHPQIPAAEKRALFANAFEGYLNSDMLGLLCLAIEKNRETYLLPALSRLIEDVDRYNNKIRAFVISAAPYDKEQTRALGSLLSTRLEKQVEIDVKVDPSVIGGPFIYADGYYIDWTVKKRLFDMCKELKQGVSM